MFLITNPTFTIHVGIVISFFGRQHRAEGNRIVRIRLRAGGLAVLILLRLIGINIGPLLCRSASFVGPRVMGMVLVLHALNIDAIAAERLSGRTASFATSCSVAVMNGILLPLVFARFLGMLLKLEKFVVSSDVLRVAEVGSPKPILSRFFLTPVR